MFFNPPGVQFFFVEEYRKNASSEEIIFFGNYKEVRDFIARKKMDFKTFSPDYLIPFTNQGTKLLRCFECRQNKIKIYLVKNIKTEVLDIQETPWVKEYFKCEHLDDNDFEAFLNDDFKVFVALNGRLAAK
jgi:hypothetical protein